MKIWWWIFIFKYKVKRWIKHEVIHRKVKLFGKIFNYQNIKILWLQFVLIWCEKWYWFCYHYTKFIVAIRHFWECFKFGTKNFDKHYHNWHEKPKEYHVFTSNDCYGQTDYYNEYFSFMMKYICSESFKLTIFNECMFEILSINCIKLVDSIVNWHITNISDSIEHRNLTFWFSTLFWSEI